PEIRNAAAVIVVDMHAEATSEKVGMGRFLDGRVSAVLGSHTHVQTADETVLPGGTAVLSDAGMCGPGASLLGMRAARVPERIVRWRERFVRQMPIRFEVASGPTIVQGAIVDVDAQTGRARAVRRFQERVAA